MNKSLLLTALLFGSAVAIRGEKRSLSTPVWIADYHSLDFHGAGAPMNWAAWTDAKYGVAGRRLIPSGTAISLASGKIVPADGTTETFLLLTDAREDSTTDSISGYGVVVRGNVYEGLLPDSSGSLAVLATAVRNKARFYFQ
ncbi:hypothetical protein GO986_18720 [Deinococcus sp. HMF7620]|uniref:Uncharacterized protein n=1 Tax=Deinococcus arboris TaxID=2682977 RepID=A0A7C9LQQ9_9DEIO|nr:hypothetical protein [Deinococcus arboris]MVN88776.1 hypothetical protein [Deinococcus arboris]